MLSKGNDGSGNNEGRDSWQTSQELFDILNKQYNFVFDCCAVPENTKCNSFSSNFLNIKKTESIAWINPPFSKAREMFEHFFKVIKTGVGIYRCDNIETKIWQEVIFKHADWIFVPNKRWAYEGHTGKGSRFPSALIGIGVPPPPKELKGVILKVE